MADERLRNIIQERKDKILVELAAGRGNIPVISVIGKSLAEAWENSLIALYYYGCEIRTQYDKKGSDGNFIDPPSKDCSMRMIIEDPASEPLIHRAFPGGLEDLEEYRQEVLEGIKDHWIRDRSDPEDTRWEYTYHERLFNYWVPGIEGSINQIDRVIEELARSPHSRRSQAITWKVWEDLGIDDPACLQSIWFRILPDEDGVGHLNMNIRFRSRDAYDAAFMNCFAFIHLQEMVAQRIMAKGKEEIKLGRYIDESDSYHIYGRRLQDYQARFLQQLFTRSFEQRTWTREFAQPIFTEARTKIAEKIARQDQEMKARK